MVNYIKVREGQDILEEALMTSQTGKTKADGWGIT